MQAIRETTGRAKEYAFLACDPFWGACSCRCSYCYVAGSMRRSRAQWEAITIAPRKDFIKHLRHDAAKYRGTNYRVLLSFTLDIYCPEAVASGVTRQALETLREFDIPFEVLTKCGTRAVADFDLYGPNDAFATTLTYAHAEECFEHEPGAASPNDRERAIYDAHDRGISTWVSLEPVLSPADALWWIEAVYEQVDLFELGKLNHDVAREKEIDWHDFGIQAIALCENYRKKYYVKDDLAKYLAGVKFTNTDTRTVVRPDASRPQLAQK
jgi:DNA repair photolyase